MKYFEDILAEGLAARQIPARSMTARTWYRKKAQSLGKINESTLMKSADKERLKNLGSFKYGQMYMFYYDPKHKLKLPYYDTFPLIFPIGPAKGGFLGINFHYLPLPLRAKLMDALYGTISNNKYDDKTRLLISYRLLNNAAKYKEFKPTVKHYLTQHIRSRMVYVAPEEWDIALYLNVARFEKATQTKVWQDSKKTIKGT